MKKLKKNCYVCGTKECCPLCEVDAALRNFEEAKKVFNQKVERLNKEILNE